jgi:hypothetical protein
VAKQVEIDRLKRALESEAKRPSDEKLATRVVILFFFFVFVSSNHYG